MSGDEKMLLAENSCMWEIAVITHMLDTLLWLGFTLDRRLKWSALFSRPSAQAGRRWLMDQLSDLKPWFMAPCAPVRLH